MPTGFSTARRRPNGLSYNGIDFVYPLMPNTNRPVMFFIWLMNRQRTHYWKYKARPFETQLEAELAQDGPFFWRWRHAGGESVVLPADELPVFNVEYPSE